MFDRWNSIHLRERFAKPYVHIVFGARQTGKSTLITQTLPSDALKIDFTLDAQRARFTRDPDELVRVCQALPKRAHPHYVFVDEAQSVPRIFDAVQHLYDSDKRRWRFVLSGSSARKPRTSDANLLPGRSLLQELQPLVLAERPAEMGSRIENGFVLPFSWPKGEPQENPFPAATLDERLAFGDLPGIVDAPLEDRAELLRAYVTLYLEEEIRREAYVKDWAAFLRFLRLAAAESGQILNYSAISREIGVSLPTVRNHYQLLEDMFVGVRVPAWSNSSRMNLVTSPKFMLFDLGVRHAAAGRVAGTEIVAANPGPALEQWVGLELHRRLRYLRRGELSYFRTYDGSEVDYVLNLDDELTPIEVKSTQRPRLSDARSVVTFLDDNKKRARHGFIVCRCAEPQALSDRVTAIPWFAL